MAASRETMLEWWEHGEKRQMTHMIMLDEGNRPYFVGSREQAKQMAESWGEQVWAVYDLRGTRAQLDLERAWNI